MFVSLGRQLGLDRAAVRRGLLLALAAWIAFALASVLHIANAYWAAMPVWVVAQASRGLLIERGVFRVAGTCLGAGFGFGLLAVVRDPYGLVFALALWITASAALTHVLRGVTAYGALMCGMTAAVVVLPSVLAPERSFEIAVARVECTLIGVVVVTLVTGLFTPEISRAAFYDRVRRLAADAIDHAARVAGRGAPEEEAPEEERRLLLEIGRIQQAAGPASAGSFEGRRRLAHVDAVTVTVLATLAAAHAPVPGGVDPADLAHRADRIRRGERSRPPGRLDGASRLVTALADLDAAVAGLSVERTAGRRMPAGTISPQADWALGLRVGAASGGATWLAATVAYASGWPVGELAALGVCIFSMVLGSMPLPQKIAPHMLRGAIAGILVALFYRFAIQPHIETVRALILSLAPFLVLGGLARASEKTALPAIDADMCFLLAGQAVLPAVTDPVVILNEAGALMLAAALTTTSFIVLPRSPDRPMRTALAAIRRDLERLAGTEGPVSPDRWQRLATRQILRLTLHVGRLSKAVPDGPEGLLDLINLGHAILDLKRAVAQDGVSESDRRRAATVLASLAGIGRKRPDAAVFEDEADAIVDRDVARAVRRAAVLMARVEPLLGLA